MRLLPNRTYRHGSKWSIWRWTDVNPGGDETIYLTRLHLIQTPWGSIMLHWINRPDHQPWLHDHPVSFFSIILRGWYYQTRPVLGTFYDQTYLCPERISWWQYLRATDKHRICHTSPGGCLTLVICGPVTRTWGFWTDSGWIPYKEYYAKGNAV